jgi:antitoxin VapB
VGKGGRLANLMAKWKPIREPFPDVDRGLKPLDDVKL